MPHFANQFICIFEGCVVDTQTQGMVIAPLNMLWSDSLSEEGGYCVVTNKDCKVFGILMFRNWFQVALISKSQN